MKAKKPIQIDERIYLIDGYDLGVPGRTGTYVIDEEDLTLIETGPSPSVKYIKQGLESLGFSLEQVKYIIVTHIHLDHAGGAGLFIQSCPNAQIIVHPKGARHLANPKRLVAGARAVYGDSFAELFDPIIPVSEERLLIKGEGDTLQISSACTLAFFDTPGHAKHHFCIFDPVSNGIFTGDTVGIRYEQLVRDGVDLFLPSTSPNQFDPEAMRSAIERIRSMNVDRIFFGHFGMTEKVDEALKQVSEWLTVFEQEGEQVFKEGKGYNELAGRMLQHVKEYLRTLLVEDDHGVYILINVDMQVSALGLIDYYQKRNR
ncbi:MBL fold metallo-hydrolase [Virgibacillus dakarensis]|uniref:MBL fold metallo-hydrolase n=1 Tax=Lentibacillus populi TaxID=1827502 RepID=A0A9W5X5X7_9BACI|nr:MULTISPECIES: MBL fold metallo-hydrolase [Bacillaceae]MBT2214877.1 MBL fold metallo-hydrolase [Virgibacillus dakarensis]MTW84526.1 MBL fold metallo-hydrolase [Virgibacillus dakarensis]GGB47831.1 MBL fold metallo-hydrolase [Lentibacillus populi]